MKCNIVHLQKKCTLYFVFLIILSYYRFRWEKTLLIHRGNSQAAQQYIKPFKLASSLSAASLKWQTHEYINNIDPVKQYILFWNGVSVF